MGERQRVRIRSNVYVFNYTQIRIRIYVYVITYIQQGSQGERLKKEIRERKPKGVPELGVEERPKWVRCSTPQKIRKNVYVKTYIQQGLARPAKAGSLALRYVGSYTQYTYTFLLIRSQVIFVSGRWRPPSSRHRRYQELGRKSLWCQAHNRKKVKIYRKNIYVITYKYADFVKFCEKTYRIL